MYQSFLSGELATSHRADLMAAAASYRQDQVVTARQRPSRRRVNAFAAAVARHRARATDAPLRLGHAR